VLPRFGVRPIIMTGMTLGAIAMLVFFAQLTPSSSYVEGVLPGLIILGIGMPCIFAPSFSTATLGVSRHEAGVASAMVNTCQQVGGAIGTAVLSTIFATSASSYASSHRGSPGLSAAAAVHGYTTAFYVATILFLIGLLVATLLLPRRIEPDRRPAGEPAAEMA
jgi:MFS family permease